MRLKGEKRIFSGDRRRLGVGGSVEEIKSGETEVEAGVESSAVTSLLHIEPVVESERELDRAARATNVHSDMNRRR